MELNFARTVFNINKNISERDAKKPKRNDIESD